MDLEMIGLLGVVVLAILLVLLAAIDKKYGAPDDEGD